MYYSNVSKETPVKKVKKGTNLLWNTDDQNPDPILDPENSKSLSRHLNILMNTEKNFKK